MTNLQTMLAFAAALTLGALLVAVDPARAILGTASTAVGSGGESIGRGSPDTASSEAQSAAPRAVGTCVTNRMAFRTQTNFVEMTFTDFAVMPNTHYPVTHAAGCLIVDFAGEVAGDTADDAMFIRASIQGIGAAEPPEVFLGLPVAANFREMRSMRFVFPNVPAGTHTVRIEWRSLSGGTVATESRTLTIQYR